MSLVPEVEVGFWNAWLLIVPYLLLTYGGSFLFVNKESSLSSWPDYKASESRALQANMVMLLVLIVYSIFAPLASGTAWLVVGLVVYVMGMLALALSLARFASTPVDAPFTTGIYRYSRNPMYLGYLLIYLGTGIAAASWLILLLAVGIASLQHYFLIPPEERMCIEKYGDTYQEYMHHTPQWLGLPKE